MTNMFFANKNIDFSLCYYGASRNLVRGPKKKISEPFWACLGGNDTFAETVPAPYPMLIERISKMPVANLGLMHAGPDAYLNDPDLINVATSAHAVLITELSVTNISNPFYHVHPRRNDRFIKARHALVELYPEVDFTEFNFTRHLLLKLEAIDTDRFFTVLNILREEYLKKLKMLIETFSCPVYLGWIGEQNYQSKTISGCSLLQMSDLLKLAKRNVRLVNLSRSDRKPLFLEFERSLFLDQKAHTTIADQFLEQLHHVA